MYAKGFVIVVFLFHSIPEQQQPIVTWNAKFIVKPLPTLLLSVVRQFTCNTGCFIVSSTVYCVGHAGAVRYVDPHCFFLFPAA